MLDASIGLTERFTPYSISLNDDMDSKKKNTLRVTTTTTRTDRCGLDSTDSASPVKRLITMYNANGLAASKAMRRATALAVEYQGECQRYVEISVDEGTESDRWFHSAIDGLVDSEENTPTSESDDEDDWADSMYKSGDAGPLTTSETLSDFVRPPSLKAFDENAGETNEIVWEIANFSMEQSIYESNIFDHADQCWNFSFGHNNADGYGYILCLHQPQIESLQLQCTFNMYKPNGTPYSKTREQPYVFGMNSMNSRGFVNFASSDVVKRHIQENGLLKLSITLKVIGDNSGSPESKSSSTHRASFDNYPGERSICPRLVATKESPTKYHGLSTETVAPPVKFSTSCSLKVEVAGPLIMAKDDTNSPTKAKGESPKQWKDTNKKLADKKPMVDTGSVLIEADSPSKTKKSPPSPPSFKPLITFNGLYTAGTGSPDLKNDGCLSRSPTGLIAKPYITYSDATTPSIFDETDFCFPVCCNQSKYNISRRSSTSGFESPGDLIGAIDSRKNSPELVIESGSPQLEKSPTQAAAGNDQKQSTTSESLENTVNADDRTLSINRRANIRGDNDDRFHESTSSENSSNVTPRPYESFQIHAQTLLSAPKSFCTIALGCGDHVATAKASVPAKVQGKQYNLLADSLRVIAQHLDVVTVPDDAKNINLMLPFQKNNTDCDVRTISSVEGTIGDNETHDRSITRGDSDHHLPNFHIDSYSSPHSEMNSMRDLHSEMSPISPPSYSVSKYSHYSPSIDRTEDQRLTLSTIYEQNHASDNIISLNNQNTSDEDENESKRRRKDVPTESRSAKSSPDGSEFTFIGAYKQGHSPVNYVAKIKEEISAMISKNKALKRPIKLTKKIKTKIKMPTKIVVATKDIYRNSSIISMLIAFIGLALNHIVAQHVIVTVSAAAYYTALTAMKLIVLAIVMIFVVLINMSTVVKEEKSATHCSTP